MGMIKDPSKTSIPSSGGNFIALDNGQNRFRIVEVTEFYKGWKEEDGRDVSYIADSGNAEADKRALKDMGCEDISHNWGMLVIDRKTNAVGVLDVHQKTIKESLLAYWQNSEWGELSGYDVVIEKKGSGRQGTKYQVMAQPKKALTEEERQMIADSGISLTQVFDPGRYNDKDKTQGGEDTIDQAQQDLGGQVIGTEKSKVPSDPPF